MLSDCALALNSICVFVWNRIKLNYYHLPPTIEFSPSINTVLHENINVIYYYIVLFCGRNMAGERCWWRRHLDPGVSVQIIHIENLVALNYLRFFLFSLHAVGMTLYMTLPLFAHVLSRFVRRQSVPSD